MPTLKANIRREGWYNPKTSVLRMPLPFVFQNPTKLTAIEKSFCPAQIKYPNRLFGELKFQNAKDSGEIVLFTTTFRYITTYEHESPEKEINKKIKKIKSKTFTVKDK